MGYTQRLDNYPGFPDGIEGAELASKITQQVERYNVEFLKATEVVEVKISNGFTEVVSSVGKTYGAKVIVIATGTKYRQLGAPGENDLIGYKIHFCATCDFIWYRGLDVIVIGGGNSAFEESLFLAKHVNKVTLLVRSSIKASKVLEEKVKGTKNIELRLNTVTEEFIIGEKKTLAGVRVKNRETGEITTLKAAGVFLFVGLKPNAEFAKNMVNLDKRGFIITNGLLATKTPGIFAAGDVRSGSTKQAVAAMGEGAAVALAIREYLKVKYG